MRPAGQLLPQNPLRAFGTLKKLRNLNLTYQQSCGPCLIASVDIWRPPYFDFFLSYWHYLEPVSPKIFSDPQAYFKLSTYIFFSLVFRALHNLFSQYNLSWVLMQFSILQSNLSICFFLKLCHIFSPLHICSCCSLY